MLTIIFTDNKDIMKNTNLQICNTTIHPGESLTLALPLPELFSCAPFYMPIKVVHGKQAGPCILVLAAMHGNELNGTEIINQLLNIKSINRLKGTLIAIPVLNVYGLINRTRHLPSGIDLNHCFPGSEHGTHASRVAHLFISEIFDKADYCVDLQTGFVNYSNLPQVYINYANEKAKNLAITFNAPVISELEHSEGSLAAYAHEKEVPYLLYEAGEAMRFDEQAIKVGLKGIVSLMRKLDMLPHKVEHKAHNSYFASKNIWVRASSSGISYSSFSLGQYVKKGETLCVIHDPFGATDPVSVSAPENAVIVAQNNLPLVHEGEALYQLATFPEKMQETATKLEEWHEKNTQSTQTESDTTATS
jgi:predicted deacylase